MLPFPLHGYPEEYDVRGYSFSFGTFWKFLARFQITNKKCWHIFICQKLQDMLIRYLMGCLDAYFKWDSLHFITPSYEVCNWLSKIIRFTISGLQICNMVFISPSNVLLWIVFLRLLLALWDNGNKSIWEVRIKYIHSKMTKTV